MTAADSDTGPRRHAGDDGSKDGHSEHGDVADS